MTEEEGWWREWSEDADVGLVMVGGEVEEAPTWGRQRAVRHSAAHAQQHTERGVM